MSSLHFAIWEHQISPVSCIGNGIGHEPLTFDYSKQIQKSLHRLYRKREGDKDKERKKDSMGKKKNRAGRRQKIVDSDLEMEPKACESSLRPLRGVVSYIYLSPLSSPWCGENGVHG